mmetsp:Transcript_16839/g.64121  ORF Transcript_16839/g.64121 Transcript_16839/m.64121 type:complete len:94 (-) Transcript_16839:280-561(-)
MPDITSNVSFENVAREWRCKWSEDNEKASLTALQELLSANLAAIKESGATVQRVVCGSCMDFKVIMTLPAESFGAWEEAGFAPEAEFLKVRAT